MGKGFAIDHWAKQQPEKIAVLTEERSISYGELHKTASRLAAVIQKRGLKPKDSIMIFMPDCVEYFIVFYAAAKLGLSIVPANALYRDVELRQLIEQNEPKMAFVLGEEQEKLIRSVDEGLPIVCADLKSESFQTLLRSDEGVDAFLLEPTACGVRISTSGSTGKLKFVARSIESQIIPAIEFAKALRLVAEDVVLVPVPLSQQFGMVAMLGCFEIGCTVVIPPHFKAKQVFSLMEKYKVTVQYCVPTMYAKEMDAYIAAEPKPDLSALRAGMVAGAGCPSELIQWFETQLGCRLLNCYGATEVAGVTMVDYDDPPHARYTTSGRVIPGAAIEIMNESGTALACGGVGEVVCTTPHVMQGYVCEPELTAQALDCQKRFWSGDIGKMDEEGYLTICGRKKDMIIRGGYNVFPAEVEEALVKDPNVYEACVMGYQDKVLGERICAFVKVDDKLPRDQEYLRQQMEGHIAKYKLPDRVIFMEEIPTLANGKYNRPALSALLKTLQSN